MTDEVLSYLRERFDQVDLRLERVEDRFDRLNASLDAIDRNLDRIADLHAARRAARRRAP